MAPTREIPNTLEGPFARLGESHEVSVYAAIERIVQAAEAVGLDDKALLRLLDQGLTLEELLDVIEVRMRWVAAGGVALSKHDAEGACATITAKHAGGRDDCD